MTVSSQSSPPTGSQASDSVPTVLRELTEAYSSQLTSEAQSWIALITVSIFVILAQPDRTGGGLLTLPFSLGEVSPDQFYAFGFIAVSALWVLFAARHAQSIRSRSLLQRMLVDLHSRTSLPGRVDLRDAFDVLAGTSFNRVAPLAQVLQGEFQFFPESSNCPKWRRTAATWYYFVLKAFATIFYLLLPGYALIVGFSGLRTFAQPWPLTYWVVVLVSGILAGIVLLQVLWLDLGYVIGVCRRIGGGRGQPGAGEAQAKMVAQASGLGNTGRGSEREPVSR